jgi:hypothetical protein
VASALNLTARPGGFKSTFARGDPLPSCAISLDTIDAVFAYAGRHVLSANADGVLKIWE